MNRFRCLLLIGVGLLFLGTTPGQAGVLQSQAEAIAEIFPGAKAHSKNLFLSEQQVSHLEANAKAKFDSKLITYQEIRSNKKLQGYVFIDQHRLRTMPETVLVAVNPQGAVLKIKILMFGEPLDYLPPVRWLGLFEGKKLDDHLWMKQDVDAVSGATLSSWSILRSVRRSLALFDLVKAQQ
jgi:Na+-translocating ferredoxin:NAD+ oxidoreductase RnfG subunit